MYKNRKTILLIPAAGSGQRFGGELPKQFLELPGSGGLRIMEAAVKRFLDTGFIDGLLIATSEERLAETAELMSSFLRRSGFGNLPFRAVRGGSTRQESVCLALESLAESAAGSLIIIHDAVRPYVRAEKIEACLESAYRNGAAILAVPVSDTIRSGGITLERSELFAVQTPQIFDFELILRAHREARAGGYTSTDDASLAERIGKSVAMVEGDPSNIKITTRADLAGAGGKSDFRIGTGFDAHRFAEGRRLVLCGIEIPHEKGLLGHSDADAALHALMDALLGAAGLKDIGNYFPDSDPAYKDADSALLLEKTVGLIRGLGYGIANADITIIAESPKLAPYIDEMKKKICPILGFLPEEGRLGIKASTAEGMGFTGRGEGIAALASALIYGSGGGREA